MSMKAGLDPRRLRTVHLVPLTAYDADGKLNLDAQAKHISRMYAAGIRVYMPGAGTSEFHSLSATEIVDIVRVTREASGPDALIFAPVGMQIGHAIEVGTRCREVGASGVMFMPFPHPYLSTTGIRDYYLQVLDRVQLPALVYKKSPFPSDALLLELAAHPWVVGVKYAENNMHDFRKVVTADQGRIEWLCGSAERFAMADLGYRQLTAAGYMAIGFDHFALPNDSLSRAAAQGTLHRNFQGYSTQPDCDLIGLGVSAIGRIGATYSQNAKTMEEYVDMLDQGEFPVVRGLSLSRDDLIRRAVIMAIMCQGHLEYAAVQEAWLIDVKTYFATEIEKLKDLQTQGLVELTDSGIQVTPMGWYFVRGVAMVFDRYLQADRNRTRFSKII